MIWGLPQWLWKPPYRCQFSNWRIPWPDLEVLLQRSEEELEFPDEADRKLTSHHWKNESGTGAYVVQYTENIAITCISIGKRIIHHQETNPHVELKGEQKHATLHYRINRGVFHSQPSAIGILPIYVTPQAVARWIHPLKCQPEKDFRGRVRG